jgi:hypothetical protein
MKMKKNLLLPILFLSSLSNQSLFPADAVVESPTTTVPIEVTVAAEKGAAISPSFLKKFNSLEKIKNVLQQKLNCLILDETQCSEIDQIFVHYALGFTLGAAIPILVIYELLTKYNAVSSPSKALLAQALAELILVIIGLRGAAVIPYTHRINNVINTAFFVLLDIVGIAQQAQKEPSRLFIFKALGNYLAMNIKCIWSTSYCQPSLAEGATVKISPLERRKILYFWLGLLSGITARKAIGIAREKIYEIQIILDPRKYMMGAM